MISFLSPFRFFHPRRLLPSFSAGIESFALGTVAAWAAVGVGVAGIGASMYGANKNAKAQAAANAANQKAQEDANRLAYQQWLMSRGIGMNGEPVNTKLPLWASAPAGFGVPKGQRRFRRASAARIAAAAPQDASYANPY